MTGCRKIRVPILHIVIPIVLGFYFVLFLFFYFILLYNTVLVLGCFIIHVSLNKYVTPLSLTLFKLKIITHTPQGFCDNQMRQFKLSVVLKVECKCYEL